MPPTVAPARLPTSAPPGSFFALVKSIHTGMFSSRVNCLFVEVLSGSVGRGEPVEVVRPDGGPMQLVARQLRKGLGEIVLDVDEPRPEKKDLLGAAVVRSPGLAAPTLPPQEAPALERLLEAVRNARRQGFPPEWATPIRPIAGFKPEDLCGLLWSLSDEAIVLLVRKRVHDALGEHGNPFEVMPDAQRAAAHLGAVGLGEDGDRLLLAVAAAVQGHKAGALLRLAGAAGAMGVLGAAKVGEAGFEMGRRVGWALGIEMGDVFAKQFQSNVAVGGEVVETALLEAGRAVGVGWCKGCRDVVQLTFGRSGITGSRELRCPKDNRKVDDPLIVVPADAVGTIDALRNARR